MSIGIRRENDYYTDFDDVYLIVGRHSHANAPPFAVMVARQ